MNADNPIDLLFGGMEKLGVGSNAETLHVLSLLPKREFQVTVDAGCGAGRQTIVLAKQLGTLVHAIDCYEPFLTDLTVRSNEMRIGHLIETHCMDMKDIPRVFGHIDLLWSEGAAYNIGFSTALTTWATALRPSALAVVSELSWLREEAPEEVSEFWQSAYPAMQSTQQNIAVAESSGYKALMTYTLSREAWTEDFYDVLKPRARSLLAHADSSVTALANETLKEIEIFNCSAGSYGYVFYVLQRV
jgi:trans-aconitate methyltransferase